MERLQLRAFEIWAAYVALPGETQTFIAFIVVLTFLFHLRFTRKTVHYAPTILTTTGIFATFVAIAIGLSGFDTSDVQGSVPSLLSSLKTAFWASVCGVGGALTLKFRDYVLPPGVERVKTAEDVTILDLLTQLREIQEALVGREDTSLITQLKLARQDSNDRLDSLRAAQTEALQKLSEMGSKALVEALRDVIRDFNVRITEQFGDNFRQLNDAVGKLLTWQEEYKAQVEEGTEQLKRASASMEVATSNYEKLVDRATAFSAIADDLSRLLAFLADQQTNIRNVATDLSNLLIKASDSLPSVESKIVEIAEQLSNSVTENQRVVGSALTENSTAIRNSIQTATEELSKSNSEHSRQIAEMVSKSKEQITALDAALSEELTKSLESLGRQLTALSDRFVSDYTPLTDRLRRVVEMARV
jgi:ABC-type transporter Mla subunit MlaD